MAQYITLAYNENVLGELEKTALEDAFLDGVIIDMMQTGFSMQVDQLSKFIGLAKRVLNPHGVMLFVKSDNAITLTRDDPGGGLVINVYDSPYSALLRYPILAQHACATVSSIDKKRLVGSSGNLSRHILLSSTPVLTRTGKKAQTEFSLPFTQNWVMQLIDDYTTVEAILHKLESRQLLSQQEGLCVLQEFENQKFTYPIFQKVEFLADCYHNRKPFRLGHFMLACGLLGEAQLTELLEKQLEDGEQEQRLLLGVLAVRAGFLSTRQLQVLLSDQYLYGGYHRMWDDSMGGSSAKIDTVRDTMIGSLGAIDPPGLLQSLNTANKCGLLTSENQDDVLTVSFSDGKATHAKLNTLKGLDALTEFITTWTEGIFVFRDQGTSVELDGTTEVKAALDRVLLDSALCADHINQVLATLPLGRETILERVDNFSLKFHTLNGKPLLLLDETEVDPDQRSQIEILAKHFNGLSTLDNVVRSFRDWPTHKVYKIVELLTREGLLVQQKSSVFKPLNVFQQIVAEVRSLVGGEANKVLLHSSLHYVSGQSPYKSVFQIDQEGYVSLSLSELKASGASASTILPELRQWMEAYIAYSRQKANPSEVDQIVKRVVRDSASNETEPS